ncbi:right-handed parallel beta-helix repeat-containing protein [Bizionia arctica]|uniref:T9SS C-terminal target domain-containing protein n=1 Tax=Bizionia arctica TaxID=1495645 RepID=A0A917GB35_9FLAO|nr:right-handed parallel beta-helix repeat-containing protein [Bizionia arctica]GGG34679.1 hypothetical protein GCM10010976_02960 [Bizionia arctica]
MKKLTFAIIGLLSITLTGCFKDDDTPIVIEETTIYQNGNGGTGETCPIIVKAGGIALDETWVNDNIYILDRKVVVQDGVTLTIEPGTIIKGRAGQGSLSSALIVAQGGKIMAQGTPQQPIIFTSESDNITCGETSGTNLDENNRGLWGGLLIMGYAPCSLSGDVVTAQIEGIPADDTFGLYGGTNPTDDSGVLSYISIRHGGTLLGDGNEINGLTLGGVGSGTTIDNIEVVANVDDGIEFFGGSVNATNLLIWAVGDDSLDIDQAYSGTIDNAVIILGDNSDHALEIDGPEGNLLGSYTIQNVTMKGNLVTANGEYADYRSRAMGANNNIFGFNFKDSSDVELDNDAVAENYNNGTLTFSNWEIVLPSGVANITDIFNNAASATTPTPGFGTEATAVNFGSQTVGANTSVLSWTYASELGALNF